MKTIKQIISLSFYPLICFKNLFAFFRSGHSGTLRVLIYHDIPPAEANKFREQLEWLKKSWTFVSPETFELMMMGKFPINGNNLLLTFDDGFSSNKIIAETILNDLDIKALFFVISEFIDIQKNVETKNFISKKILLQSEVESIPSHMSNMTWKDLVDLCKAGHAIGAHTSSHIRLSNLKSEKELYNEIVKSADFIENQIGIKVNHFAYPFGNISSFPQDAFNLAHRRFNFIHSGLRGCNIKCKNKKIVFRDALQTTYSFYEIDVLLEGFFDLYYSKSRKLFNNWALTSK
jgi:peptidoglycan/xylan/chitin deacetylase (PgdA/CDA1 family)